MWFPEMELNNPEGRRQRSKFCTQLLFYAHLHHIRAPHHEPQNIFRGGRLYQELLCDNWASIDQSNCSWIRANQDRFRSHTLNGLVDQAAQDATADLAQLGRRVILPSSHPGSDHHMYQLLQDSLAICRDSGKPDIFLTMTANPAWPEIVENLLPGKTCYYLL